MNISSPLRYPGGKAAMAGLLSQIRRINGLGGRSIAEPYAGGAGASLTLLFLEETNEIFINDADRRIHDFWWSITNQVEPFLEKLSKSRASMAEWFRQREIYNAPGRRSRLDRGFATFYLNRCNRSGIIINGGPIGGMEQTGKWKINARYNKPSLAERCQKISEYSNRIHISSEDGINFIDRYTDSSVFFFIDPPYYNKGAELYMNGLSDEYHRSLADKLRDNPQIPWVLTYDDCHEIRKLYRGWSKIKSFGLRYSAANKRVGREIMIVPEWMNLPKAQESDAISW